MEQNNHDFLDGLETAENAPIVVSPYGFKKIQLDGKTYLTPMTEQEYMDVLTQYSLSQFESEATPVTTEGVNPTCADDPFKPSCWMNSMHQCISQCCSGRCKPIPPVAIGDTWSCGCYKSG